MDLRETMAELEAMGTAQNRMVYGRHGVDGPMFGVSYGNLDKLKKKVGTDTELAIDLWATGNHDARVLATKVADPGEVGEELLAAWVEQLDNYVLTDAFSSLAARSPHAAGLMRRWTASHVEWTGAAGWNLVASLAQRGAKKSGVTDDDMASRLDEIEAGVHQAANRVRHSMNQALISIGAYRSPLTARAMAVAEAVGPVEVDHGDTGCKTPAAGPYIEKTRAHLEKKAAKKR